MNLLNTLQNLYYRYRLNPVQYARHLGVKLGNNCSVGIRAWSSEPYLIEIGNNVAITRGVMIHTHGGGRVARSKYPNFDVFGKVKISDNVYIGSGAQIMPGVTIGEGALVAAGSIVTKSVPPNAVVGGNPAKYICSVEEYINHNIKYDLGTKQLSPKEKKEVLMNLPDNKFIIKPFLKNNEK